MKLFLWLIALWLTAVTAAPIKSSLFSSLFSAKKGGSLAAPKVAAPKVAAPAKAPPAVPAEEPAAVPAKAPSVAAPKASEAAAPAKAPAAASAKPIPVASAKAEPSVKASSEASVKSSAAAIATPPSKSGASSAAISPPPKSASSAASSAASASTPATSAINLAAWPAHPVDAGDIPTDQQLAAQKPIDTLSLPALDATYYTGPQVPANFSLPGETNAQAVNDVAEVQKPDNVGGQPLAVPQTELGLRRRGKVGAATGAPAQVFDPKGSLKPRCPKKFQDVVPFLNKPLQHEAMFYSAVDQFEYKFAEQKHLALVKPSLDPTYLIINDKCKNFWDLASQAWASVASGDVFVLLPDVTISPIDAKADKSSWPLPQWPAVRSGQTSIWEKIEWPQLKANPAVCRVWRVGQNSQPLLLMVRTGPQCSYTAVTP